MDFDSIRLDARLATLAPERSGLGLIENGAVATRDGRIAFAGTDGQAAAWMEYRPKNPTRWPLDHARPRSIATRTWCTAGERADEFALRLAGVSLRGDRARRAAASCLR